VPSERQINVPDIGDFHDVEVIELLVAVGDRVRADQTLITLESEKATMEIPSPAAGVVKALAVGLGDKVSEGSLIATLEVDDEIAAGAPPPGAPAASET
jgi:dihydrolipoamide dehydrogenase